MKKMTAVCLVLVLVLSLIGCSGKNEIKHTIEGSRHTYHEMTDGTWMCNDSSYDYRLEITGKLNNTTSDITYVYLSNLESITFEQAWKASGISSNLHDYFSPEDAVLVDISQE